MKLCKTIISKRLKYMYYIFDDVYCRMCVMYMAAQRGFTKFL